MSDRFEAEITAEVRVRVESTWERACPDSGAPAGHGDVRYFLLLDDREVDVGPEDFEDPELVAEAALLALDERRLDGPV